MHFTILLTTVLGVTAVTASPIRAREPSGIETFDFEDRGSKPTEWGWIELCTGPGYGSCLTVYADTALNMGCFNLEDHDWTRVLDKKISSVRVKHDTACTLFVERDCPWEDKKGRLDTISKKVDWSDLRKSEVNWDNRFQSVACLRVEEY